MSPQNDHNILAYKTSEFLDTKCLHNVSAHSSFARSESGYISESRPGTHILVSRSYSMDYAKKNGLATTLSI